ncbi:MAG: hypothetical protein ACOVOT_02280 [Rubrivivax sp.]|jgi:hypothetical protein
MQDSHRTPDPASAATDERRTVSIDRRRLLLRGGAAATPVILSLASQPVSATGLIGCTKASGFVSMNTFASQQPGVNFIQCTSNGLSFWRTQAGSWSPGSGTHVYRRELNKSVATFFDASGCAQGTSIVGSVLGGTLANSGSAGVLQRLLALGLSVSYGMVPSPNNFSALYLGQIWVNFNGNSLKYMTGVPNESMDAAQLIIWLDRLTTATPITNSAA